jgi:hypothetical protein
MKKNIVKVSAFIGAMIGLLSLVALGMYHVEYQKHMTQKRASFFVDIEVTSSGHIERMEYSICEERTPVTPYDDVQDGHILWGATISTPAQLRRADGIPCPVELLLVTDGKMQRYSVNQLFDCPDCDGTHYYTVTGDAVVYTYFP